MEVGGADLIIVGSIIYEQHLHSNKNCKNYITPLIKIVHRYVLGVGGILGDLLDSLSNGAAEAAFRMRMHQKKKKRVLRL